MKHIFSIAILVAALSLASCRKDRTCECTTSHASGSYDRTTTYKKISKSKAKKYCPKEETENYGGGASTVTCKLK